MPKGYTNSMNAVVGLILVVVVLWGVWFMYQGGFFAAFADTLNAITTGFDQGYGGRATSTPVSPNYHRARIRFVSLGQGLEEKQEVLIVVDEKAGGFNITGWKVKTNLGTFTIPKAHNAYSPSTKEAAPETIYVRGGDRLVLHNGKSPTGRNERVSEGEWHIWFEELLTAPHGKIILNDEKGKLVDQYEY